MRWHLWVPTVSGTLAGHADGYERWLNARGYSPGLITVRRWQLGQLSVWLVREGLTIADLSDGAVGERFADAMRAAGHRTLVSKRSLRGSAGVSE